MVMVNQDFVDCLEGFQCDGNYCLKRHCKRHKDCPNDQRCNRKHICKPIPCRYVNFEKRLSRKYHLTTYAIILRIIISLNSFFINLIQ